jgi:hypothetical protein
MRSLLGVPGIENLSAAGRRAVLRIADAIETDPDYLVTVMSFETGHSFSTSQKNAAGSGATGLIQFMPSTAGSLGYTTAQLAAQSQEEQILGPVWQYFHGWTGKLKSLDDVYLVVFYPAAIGKSDDWVVASEGSKVYEQNRGFDTSGSGVIRRSDITGTIRSVYNAARNRPRVDVPDAPILWRPIFNIALFGAFAFSAYAIAQWGRDRTIKTPAKLLSEAFSKKG